MTTYMPRKDAAAPDHVCPGIRIHAIDIVQPPGIGMPPIDDMDAHHAIVSAALAAKSSAVTPKKARWEPRPEAIRRANFSFPDGATTPTTSLSPRLGLALVVLVVAAEPEGPSEITHSSYHRLVAPAGRAVEPLVHAPETVQPARVRRAGVVDDAVLSCPALPV